MNYRCFYGKFLEMWISGKNKYLKIIWVIDRKKLNVKNVIIVLRLIIIFGEKEWVFYWNRIFERV